eukprot:TRINITY_DN67328_c0_g1_i1.p1 TRINITY_DN67328_c0_g1~~TRINITY_DN67328_c0_g1_i1.p1  ORF type:complete len:656 (-),score=129.42 TRINITY_DN67328_c0_g1_i1:150-2117(-)
MRASHSAAALIIGNKGLGVSLDTLKRPQSAGKPTPRIGGVRLPVSTFKPNALQKIEFRFSTGGHGLAWDNAMIVTARKGQAETLGVQLGWKLYAVDGVLLRDSQEAWSRLQEAQWQWRTCNVVFVTDFRAIRAEQKMIQITLDKIEAERLAKLPFANTQDETHLGQLKEKFIFQGYIDGVENRAIQVSQLQSVLKWSSEKCHRWRDAGGIHSRTADRKLNLDFMNMCHLMDWVIRPATKSKDCSLVELLTNQKQTTMWYASFWWGDLLNNLVDCLKFHTKRRELAEDIPYWLAPCANRPHSTNDAFSPDPKSTCFHKAMAASSFRVLLIVDKQTEYTNSGTCVGRLWCCYELGMCVETPNTVLDIVIPEGTNKRPAMVTHAFTDEERSTETMTPGAGYKAQADNQKNFGHQMAEVICNAQVGIAQCSFTEEKQKIWNSIAGLDISTPLPEKMPEACATHGKRLRKLLALAFWRRTMSGAVSDTEMQKIQTRVMDALRNDTWCDHLDLTLAFLAGGPEKLKLLTTGFSPALRELRLDLRNTELVNDSIAHLATNLPRDLEDLTIEFNSNDQIDTVGLEVFVAKLPPKVRNLRMNLENTNVCKEYKALQASLESLKGQIAEEARKADRCTIVNLCPSPSRRMVMSVSKSKLAPINSS